MRPTLLLAGLLIFASPSHAQVREEMAPPAPAGVPDTEYCPPDASNGIDNFDSDWSGGLSVDINAPSDDSDGGSAAVPQGPDVVEGMNDGPYVPSTFVPYQKALHEGMQELAEMRGEATAETGQTPASAATSKSSQPVNATARPHSWPDAATIASEISPQVWPKPETVAEAARENQEKLASGEKAKVIVSQDDSGGVVVTEEPQESSPKNSQ